MPLRASVLLIAGATSVAVGCTSGDGSASVPTVPTVPITAPTTIAPAPPFLTAITEAGYPRDLLQRGRVNVETTNAGEVALRVTSRELLIDYFRSPGPEVRRSLIAAGATVDLQTAHGEVVDCSATAPLTARAVLTYHEDGHVEGGDTQRTVAVPIGDTAILDTVRARACAARALTDAFSLSFSEPVVDGEALSTVLRLDRRSESPVFRIDRAFGTVLFGVERIDESPSTIEPGADAATVALRFDVNRCDAHAVAETTKKFGLQLEISIGGASPVWTEIDVAELGEPLDAILDACKARTGS